MVYILPQVFWIPNHVNTFSMNIAYQAQVYPLKVSIISSQFYGDYTKKWDVISSNRKRNLKRYMYHFRQLHLPDFQSPSWIWGTKYIVENKNQIFLVLLHTEIRRHRESFEGAVHTWLPHGENFQRAQISDPGSSTKPNSGVLRFAITFTPLCFRKLWKNNFVVTPIDIII